MEFHVYKSESTQEKGTLENAFFTIGKAASLAHAGDTIIVHKGIYREWVNPVRGGTKEQPIVYRSAGDGEVVITGAEQVAGWEYDSGNTWKIQVQNTLFTMRNPFDTEVFGDWLFEGDFKPHLGEVYLDGKSLYECESIEKVRSSEIWPPAKYSEDSKLKWYAIVDEENTSIWANFGGKNPNEENVEISVRPYCFWPEKVGVNYIAVNGFTLRQAAPQWAPPTALQEGLIGPHWSKGWIIENNIISESKNAGISLGKDISTGDNEWSKSPVKGGTQREQEVIFRALNGNWNKEHIGSHIVRNNVIHDCEQAGIVGHLGAVFSEISDNRIYNIHHKRIYHGAEVGGIKLHAALDTQICGNVIYSSYRGLWLDWQAQGTRISRNIFYDNLSEDFFVEVCHGPYMVDHNLFLSLMNFRSLSQGGAFIHNLFAGRFLIQPELNRYTPYHIPHSTAVAGYANFSGGDDRFYLNIFIGDEDMRDKPVFMHFFEHLPIIKPEDAGGQIASEAAMDGVPEDCLCRLYPVGLSMYSDYPSGMPKQPWEFSEKEKEEAMAQYGSLYKLKRWTIPVKIERNLYLNNAVPDAKENSAVIHPEKGISIHVDPGKHEVCCKIERPDLIRRQGGTQCDSKELGVTYHAEMAYEQPDGLPYHFDQDFFGNPRPSEAVTPGPFELADDEPINFVMDWKE